MDKNKIIQEQLEKYEYDSEIYSAVKSSLEDALNNVSERSFVDYIFWNPPSENTPKWIKGKLSFRAEEFANFLKENKNDYGYVWIDIKESKDGKIYFELNDIAGKNPNKVIKYGNDSL